MDTKDISTPSKKDGGNTCETCGYFRRHYIWHQGYMPINFGHCVHPPRVRHCRPGLAACAKWRVQNEEYLSTYVPPETMLSK